MSILNSSALWALLGLLLIHIEAYCIYNNVKTSNSKRETTYWLRQQPYNAGPNYFSYVTYILPDL